MARILVQIWLLFQLNVKEHYNLFFNGFDPVKSEYSNRKINFRKHFGIAFCIWLYTVVQGVIGFGDRNEDRGLPFSEAKRFITHQMFPPQFWYISDIMVLFSMCAIFIFYVSLVTFPMLGRDCDLYLDSVAVARDSIDPNQVLTSSESRKVLAFRDNAKRAMKIVLLIWIAGLQFYFLWQMISTEKMTVNIGSVFYWVALVPMFLGYCVYVELILIIYFAMTCKCIQIRQQSILDRFAALKRRTAWLTLNSDDPELPTKALKSSRTAPQLIWREFLQLNSRSIHICGYVKRSNRFWSRYLTYDFILFSFFICYSTYILLLGNIGFGPKWLFFFLANYSLLSLLLIIKQCSAIVEKNRAITRYNFYFFRLFQSGKFGLKRVLKAENLTLSLWEKPGEEEGNAIYGYRLLNNHRIDFGTFYIAFYNISVVFMLNFRTRPYESTKE